MTLKETLAALDAAATQGEWLIRRLGHDHVQVHNGMEHEVLSSPRAGNAALATALVNLYRTGQLVPVPSVESVARAICEGVVNQDDPGFLLPEEWDGILSYLDQGETDFNCIAQAVINAMKDRW